MLTSVKSLTKLLNHFSFPQTKILKGRTNIRERLFEVLFKCVSTRFLLRSFEKHFENTFPNVRSAFQNLRLSQACATHPPCGKQHLRQRPTPDWARINHPSNGRFGRLTIAKSLEKTRPTCGSFFENLRLGSIHFGTFRKWRVVFKSHSTCARMHCMHPISPISHID